MNYLYRNFSVLGIGVLLSNFLKYLTMIYLIRTLGVTDYGKLSFALAFLSYFILLVDFGFSLVGVREVAKNIKQADELLSDIVVIKFSLAIISYVIIIGLVITIDIPEDTRYLIATYGIILFFCVFNFDWLFQAFEKMPFVSAFRSLRGLIAFVLVVALIKGQDQLILIPVTEIVALFSVVLLTSWFMDANFLKKKLALRTKKLFLLSKEAFPAFLTLALATIYNNIDIIMLTFYEGEKTVGIYSAAYKIINLGLTPIILWYGTMMPKLSQQPFNWIWYLRFVKINLIIGLVSSTMIFVFAKHMILLLYGKEFSEAIAILRLLSLIPLMAAFAGSFANVLTPYGMQRLQLYATAFGALTNVALNFLFIPKYGMFGSALATILAELAVGLSASYFLFRTKMSRRLATNWSDTPGGRL